MTGPGPLPFVRATVTAVHFASDWHAFWQLANESDLEKGSGRITVPPCFP